MPPLILEVPGSLAGERLDHILDRLVPDHSRARLQKLVRKGRVRIDGRRVVRSNLPVPGKATIEIDLGSSTPARPVRIVHEEASFLVVEKDAGVLTHWADRSRDPALADLLEASHGPLSRLAGDERPGIVHRLDRETSGLLVVARSDEAMRALKHAFASRTVEKRYLALVHGVPADESFELTDPIGPVPGKADRQQTHPPAGARSARTAVALVESLGQHALLACMPHTGRRHQIRVHLAAHGLPVMKDPLYGTRRQTPLPPHIPAPPRLALHAAGLTFPHPESGEHVTFEADLPEDLRRTVLALRPPH